MVEATVYLSRLWAGVYLSVEEHKQRSLSPMRKREGEEADLREG